MCDTGEVAHTGNRIWRLERPQQPSFVPSCLFSISMKSSFKCMLFRMIKTQGSFLATPRFICPLSTGIQACLYHTNGRLSKWTWVMHVSASFSCFQGCVLSVVPFQGLGVPFQPLSLLVSRPQSSLWPELTPS